jgi:hypothetical protein
MFVPAKVNKPVHADLEFGLGAYLKVGVGKRTKRRFLYCKEMLFPRVGKPLHAFAVMCQHLPCNGTVVGEPVEPLSSSNE